MMMMMMMITESDYDVVDSGFVMMEMMVELAVRVGGGGGNCEYNLSFG